LEVADGVGLLHELCGLAEIGLFTGGIHQCANFAPAYDRSRENRLAGFARGGQGFAGQGRFIHLHRVTLEQARVRRHNITQTQANDIAGYQFPRRRGDPFSIPLDAGIDGQLGLQGGDRVARLTLFPESDHGVGHEQYEDNAEVRPVPDHARKDHRHLDHPGNRTPEIREEFQQRIGLFFFDLVGTILGQPLCRLGLSETVRRGPQSLLHLRHGQRFQLVLRLRLRRRCFGLDGLWLHDE
jgi:hypothetical protein